MKSFIKIKSLLEKITRDTNKNQNGILFQKNMRVHHLAVKKLIQHEIKNKKSVEYNILQQLNKKMGKLNKVQKGGTLDDLRNYIYSQIKPVGADFNWKYFKILIENPNSFDFIQDYFLDELDNNQINNQIVFLSLHNNNNALDYLEKNRQKIDWTLLAKNENFKAIELIEEKIKNDKNIFYNNFDVVFWIYLCENKNAFHLFTKDRIDKLIKNIQFNFYKFIALNKNPDVIPLITSFIEKIKKNEIQNQTKNYEKIWESISFNPNAVDILKNNPKKINYNSLAFNENTDCLKILEDYIDNTLLENENKKTELTDILSRLCTNSNAGELLEKYKDNFDSTCFDNLQNSNISEKAYEIIKQRKKNDEDYYYLSNNKNPENLNLVLNKLDTINNNWKEDIIKNINGNEGAYTILCDWAANDQGNLRIEKLLSNKNPNIWESKGHLLK